MKNLSFAVTLTLAAASTNLLCTAVSAAEQAKNTEIIQTTAFDRLKSLAGEWSGKEGDRNTGSPITVSYKTISNGSVVIETLFPGTKHEMVTAYYLDKGRLTLTHYCAMGNQPRMVLTRRSTPGALEFELSGGTNLNPRKDLHMHSARIRFESENTISAEWDTFRGGKKGESARLYLTRKTAT